MFIIFPIITTPFTKNISPNNKHKGKTNTKNDEKNLITKVFWYLRVHGLGIFVGSYHLRPVASRRGVLPCIGTSFLIKFICGRTFCSAVAIELF